MKKKPLISIITVVYNGDKYLEQTIKSVIGQTYRNIEYIIIDGGSKDKSVEIIKKYESLISFWVSEADEGLYHAMNKGISRANGELVGMINSDDWYQLDAVEQVVSAYLENPLKNIFHGDAWFIFENGNIKLRKFQSSPFKFKYYGMVYLHPTMFVSKEEYEKHTYNTDLDVLADYQFVLESYLKNKDTFCYVEKPIANFRLDGISGQMSRRKALHEGFQARRNAGLSWLECSFSRLLRALIFYIFMPLKNKIKSQKGNTQSYSYVIENDVKHEK